MNSYNNPSYPYNNNLSPTSYYFNSTSQPSQSAYKTLDYREKRNNEYSTGLNSGSPRGNNLINPNSTYNGSFYSNSSREKFYNPRGENRERESRYYF